MRTAVIIPCSKTKRSGRMKARDKYRGRIFPYVLQMQKDFGFDLYIYSAKYGIISENEIISDYELTFKTMSKEQVKKQVKHLQTEKRVHQLSKKYDKVIISVGKDYEEGLKSYDNVTLIQREPSHNRKGGILAPATALYDFLKLYEKTNYKKLGGTKHD